MNREIKFRAWDKVTEKFVTMQDIELWSCADPVNNSWTVRSAPNTEIMQYTGLKDKNGVEIYEGDLLETDMNKKVFEIVFLNYSWCATSVRTKSNWNLNETYSLSDYLRNLKKGSANFEVIGNIYQNPELIK